MRHTASVTMFSALSRLSKRALPAIAMLLLSAPIFSVQAFAAGGDPVWQQSDNRAGKQAAIGSVTDSQGNLIVAGFQKLAGGNDDFYVVKFKADGTGVAWRAAIDNAGGSDQINDVAVDSADNVIVSGTVWNGTNSDILTIKFDSATGAPLWQQTFNGGVDGNDGAAAIAADGSNNVYVGGYSQNNLGYNDYLIIKYPAAGGAPLWQARYSGTAPGTNKIAAIAVGAGGVAVTGYSWNGTIFETATIKYDLSGNQVWALPIRHSDNGHTCLGKSVKMDSAGNVIIAASSSNGSDLDVYLAKYGAADGSKIWDSTYDGLSNDEPKSIAMDASGNVYVTGYTYTDDGHNDFYTTKHHVADGGIVWRNIFDSGNGNTEITAESDSIAVDPGSGEVFVTGYAILSNISSMETVKYNSSNGNVVWQRLYNGTAGKNSRAVGLGLSPAGDVLVAGWSDTLDSDLDFVAIKYDRGPLNQPTGLSAITLSDSSIKISWASNSVTEDGFKIERCTGFSCSGFVQIGTVLSGVTTFTDTALTRDTYYSYQVRAYNAAYGNSLYSNLVQGLTTSITAVPPAWAYTYDSGAGSDDYASAIAIGLDNNPVAAGATHDYRIGYSSGNLTWDYLTIKLNSGSNTPIWAQRYDDPTIASDFATCVTVDSTNKPLVSGYATLANVNDIDVNSLFTIKYDTAGNPLVNDQYNGPGATDDRAAAIATAVDASNNVAVVGYGKNVSGNDDIYLLKFNPDGSRAWAATPFDGAGGDDYPSAVAFAPDGSIYVTGYSEKLPATNPKTYKFFTARYSSAGALIWNDLHGVTATGTNRSLGMAIDADGDVYVTGYATNASGDNDFYTIKYKGGVASAERTWAVAADGAGHAEDRAAGVAIDKIDGNIVVAGTSTSLAGDTDYRVIRYNQAGAVVRDGTYQKPGGNETANAMALDSNGNTYVTGNTSNGVTQSSLTTKFDSQGNAVGNTVYSGTGDTDDTVAIAVNSNDEVFAAGYASKADITSDLLVYKISPTQPTTPSILTAAPGYASVAFGWPGSSISRDGFRLERKSGACSVANANPWSAVATVSPVTLNYTDNGLTVGTTYCYHIQAFMNTGVTSRWKEAEITTLTPGVPSAFSAVPVNTTRVNTSWTDQTNGETGYRIERCAGTDCTTDFTSAGTAGANANGFTDTTACSGTVYRYRVIATGAGWESLPSTTSADVTTVAAAESTLSATRISEAEIDLSWNDPNGDETGYAVERCQGAGCSDFAAITTLAAGITTFKNTGLSGNNTYLYRIRGYKSDNCSWQVYSNTATADTTITPPGALTATPAGTTSVNLSWTDNTASETGFTIEKCVGSGCDVFTQIGTVTSNINSYADATACSGDNSTYRVKATRNTAWDSAYSDAVSTTTPQPAAPVLSSAARASEAQINVSWTDSNADRTGFKLWRCAGSGCSSNFTQVGGTITATSYNDAGLLPNTSYTYYVETFKTSACGWSKSSGQLTATTTLLEPNGITATANNSTQITVGWTGRSSTQTGFKILRCQGSGCTPDATPIYTAAANAASYIDTAVAESSTYNYQVMATNSVIPWDSTVSAKVERATPAAAPPALTAGRVSETQISLSWTDSNTDRTGFRLWRCTGAGCSSFLQLGGTMTTTTYNDNGLAPDASYTYYVETFKTATNGWVKQSPQATQVTTVFAPSNLTATANNTTQITLDWTDNSNNESGFEVWRCAGNGCTPAYLALTAANVVTYQDSSANAGITYNYQVRAVNTTVPWNSAYASIAAPVTTASPSNPVLVSATEVSETQINLSWSDTNSDRTGFKLWRCSGASCSTFQSVGGTITGTTYNDTGLTANTDYTYYVEVLKTATNSWSRTSGQLSATSTVAPPSGLSAAGQTTTQIKLVWTNTTTTETGFVVERCSGAGCSDFAPVTAASSLSAHSTTFNDNSVCNGVSYTYRMKSTNNSLGWASGYSNTSTASTAASSAASPNLLADPNFEDAASGWTAAPNTGATTNATIATDLFSNGAKSLKVVPDGSNAVFGRSQPVTVTGGQQYVLSGYINASLTAGSAICNVYGTGITTDPGIGIVFGNADNNSTWVNLNEVVSIPGGTGSVMVQCFTTANSTGTVYFDRMSLSKVFTVTPTTVNEAKIKLDWTDISADENGYNILRCTAGVCSQLGSVGAGVTTYTDSGLTPPGSSYSYQVQAYKTATCGWTFPASAVATGSTAAMPPAPDSLTATADSTTQITVNWTNNTSSETGIVVERCQQGLTCPTYSAITTTGAGINSYVDTNVIQGTTYQYQVKAVNSALSWASAYSPSVSKTTLTAAAPTLVSAVAVSETQINLTWTDTNTDRTGFRLWHCTGAGCSVFSQVGGTITGTSYSDSGLSGNTSYTYYVETFKTATNSWAKLSLQSSTTTTPPAPSGLNVAIDAADPNNSTRLKLSWTNNTTTHTGIVIERCTGNNCSSGWAAVAGSPVASTTTFTDTTVCGATWYTYRVSATNGTWTSAASTPATATTKTPVAPAGLTLSPTANNEGQLTLSWSLGATSDATGFNVYRCSGGGCTITTPGTPTYPLSGIVTKTYTDNTGLLANTSYTYKVTASKGSACSESAAASNSATTPNPAAPSGLTATALNSTSVQLSWQDNTSWETGFKIERCTGANCSSVPANFSVIDTTSSTAGPNTAAASTWTDTTAAAVTSYQYRIRAANAAWTAVATPGYSAYNSPVASVTTPNAGPPGPINSTDGTNKVALTWGDNCSGATQETGFNVLRCTGSGCTPASTVYSMGANATASAAYTDNTLCSGTSYVYQVNATGASCTFSSTSYPVTTPTAATPVLTAVARTSEVRLSLAWTDATTDAASYTIDRCIGNGCSDFTQLATTPATLTGSTRSYDDTTVLPGTTYTYRIHGNGATVSGCGAAWQTTSNSLTQVANTSTPALSATTASLSQINLSWTDGDSNITGWKIERCSGAGCSNFTEIIILNAKNPMTYPDTNLTAGNTYRYRIRATGTALAPYAGFLWISDYSSVATASITAPVAPTALTAAMASTTQINLAWTPSSSTDLDGYAIERCMGNGCLDFAEIKRVTPYTGASSSDTPLAASTNYRYRIRGYKSAGGVYTGYSNIAEAITLMAAPGSLNATAIGSHAVKLTWSEIYPGQDTLAIMVQIWNGEWVQLASVDGVTSEYTDISGVNPLSTYTYQVRAFRGAAYVDSNLASVTVPAYNAADASICVAGPLPNQPQITSIPVMTATEGVPYTYAVVASGQSGATISSYTLSVKPNSMNIDAFGVITWTPDYTQAGNISVTVRVTDSLGTTASQSFVIVVTNDVQLPKITSAAVTTCSGVACTAGFPYSYQVVANDPEGNSLIYSLQTAPTGMSVSASGLISWPAVAGTGNVILAVSNGIKTKTQSFVIPVGSYHPIAITSVPGANGVNGATYQYQLALTNTDNYPLGYSLAAAPSGMSISSSGLVTWVPSTTQGGANSVTVTVTDGVAPVSQSFTVTVGQYNMPVITSAPAGVNVSEGVQYQYQVTASAPLGGALTYSLVTAPTGMAISASGLLTWTPGGGQVNAAAIPVTLTVQAGSNSANSAAQSFNLAGPFISSSTGTPARAGVGVAYSYAPTVNKAWASGTTTWSLDLKPAWMSINSSTGVISGTPTAGGAVTVTVRVTVGTAYTTQSYTLNVVSFTVNPATTAAVGNAYTSTATASDPAGGTPSYGLTSPPAGASINSSTGIISWTPAANQTGNINVTVTAAVGGVTISKVSTISVLSITSTAVTTATFNTAYSYQVTTTGTPSGYSLTVKPSWLSINGSGLITGTPDAIGSSIPVTVQVTTAGGYSVIQTYNLTARPAVNAPAVTTAAVGSSYSSTVTATPTGSYTFALTSPPSGMTIDSTGVITWTAPVAGTTAVTATATTAGVTGTVTFNISGLSITDSTTMDGGAVGAAYSYQVHTTGTPTGYSFTNTPPTGMTINASTGLISWPSPTIGTYNPITVRVTTNGGYYVTQSFTLNVTVAAVHTSKTFICTGAMESYSIPAGAVNIQFSVKGAGGGGGRYDSEGNQAAGSPGHTVDRTYPTAGVTLNVYVGCGGQLGNGSTGAIQAFGKNWGGAGGNGEESEYEWASGGSGGGGSSAITLSAGTLLAEARGGNGGRSSDYYSDYEGYIYSGGAGGAGGGSDNPAATSLTSGGAGGGTDTPGAPGTVTITYDQ